MSSRNFNGEVMKIPELYRKNNVDKDYTSIGLFRELKKKYDIVKVFYPGCYVHITPSLVFSNVTYADSFRNTYKFFDNADTHEYIKKNKEYSEKPVLKYYQQNYHEPFIELTDDFDLVISQYAGFVGQSVKRYLRCGGLLVCNNSHGDASMASMDPDYRLAAVYRRISDERFRISDKDINTYLIPKNGIQPTKEQLVKTMRGVAYTKSPSGYIFERVR